MHAAAPPLPTADPADELLDVLGSEFGIPARRARLVGGELDRNYRVTDETGAEFLVKVTDAGIDPITLGWQEAMLEHLDGQDLSVEIPRPVRSLDGRLHVPATLDGALRLVRVFRWIPGRTLAEVGPVPLRTLRRLGRVAAEITTALGTLQHDAEPEEHHWLALRSDTAIATTREAVRDPAHRAHLDTVAGWFDAYRELFGRLPTATVHQDLNDFNVLVSGEGAIDVVGVLDFNDARTTARVADVAVAAAYAMLRQDDPLAAAAAVVAGYDEVIPLTDDELTAVYPLAAARLCVNAATWTRRASDESGEYGAARMLDTWPALAKVASIHPIVAEARFRAVCGRRAAPGPRSSWFARSTPALGGATTRLVDLGPTGEAFDGVALDRGSVERALVQHLGGLDATEVLVSPAFSPLLARAAIRDIGAAEPATIQLGTGLIAAAPHTVRVPFDARVLRVPAPGRAGILEHSDPIGGVYRSLWWGVRFDAPVGSTLVAGEALGVLPAYGRSAIGGLFSGLVQLSTEPHVIGADPPRYARPSEVAAWRVRSPDPAAFLGLEIAPAASDPAERWTIDEVLETRRAHLAPSQKHYFTAPMNLVNGRGTWLVDEHAQLYLDPINNVTHVGHAEPRVIAAASRQMHRLNTNSRLVYSGISEYAERLTSKLPRGLDTVFFVCTGSEANDLALRMSRQVTGRQHVLVIDSAYHGNTTAVMDVSPNRYKAQGDGRTPPLTREVETPDRYRGPYGYDDPDAGTHYAQGVRALVDGMQRDGTPPAAFIAEALVGTGGNYLLPPGYLRESFDAVRAAGGLCISDEVQIGFGRLGDAFWGFETHGVVPDIVTMGKPIGNGHPLAAVVTTREIAAAFDDGVRYFNTFGGNPVSCAIGLSVLDIIEQDGLQEHAAEVGRYFRLALEAVRERHPLVGDVRGQGLYLGVELVRDRRTKEPGDREALLVSEMLKDRGVIMYPNGRFGNVLKIKPPMVFTKANVDFFTATLDRVLDEVERVGVDGDD